MNNIPSQAFLAKLRAFEHDFEGDPRWDIMFSNGRRKWFYLVATFYNGMYYVSELLHDASPIQISEDGSLVKEDNSFGGRSTYFDKGFWQKTLSLAIDHLDSVQHDWVGAYQSLNQKLPYIYRQGKVHSKLVRHFCKNIWRIDEELGAENLQKFVSLVENRIANAYDAGRVKDLTAARYFEYCKVAYLNSHLQLDEDTQQLSGKDLYQMFADGRDEGLTEIAQDSVSDFRDWMEGKHPQKGGGGHPWEILRGGNTTKISLYVQKSPYGSSNEYELRLWGNSIGRIAETLKIYLALYEQNMTVSLDEPEKIRKRLLGQDSIGIVPEYLSLHRSENLFDDDVTDTLHLRDFEDVQKWIVKLAEWEQLPCLRPKGGGGSG